MKLAKEFFWGGSIAAHQLEGAWDVDGKGPAIMDYATQGSSRIAREFTKEIEPGKRYPSHEGIDFYHNYKDDIALFAEMGFTALRISVDWSRIYPRGDEDTPNEKGVKYYQDVVDTLLSHHIEPIITLYHFEMPIHLVHEYGSWMNRKVIDYYLQYCKTMFEALKGKVRYWVTFNEMNHIDPQTEASDVFTYILAGIKFSELTGDKKQTLATIGYHMTLAGVKAARLARAVDPDNQVGCVFGLSPSYAYNCDPVNVLRAFKENDRDFYQVDAMCHGEFPRYKLREYQSLGISLAVTDQDREDFREGILDFLGVNYYMSGVAHYEGDEGNEETLFGGVQNPYLKRSDWGWGIDPIGLRYLLNYTYRKYHLPIMITENGLGAADEIGPDGGIHDSYRIDYLRQHLRELNKAVNEDFVDCIGYLMWGPIDLVSATTGEMKKRYGFIYVDKHDDGSGTGARIRKDSFYWYKDLIEKQGEIEE